MKVAQLCLTLCNPMDYTVHGILQARILEWAAFPSPEDLPNPRIKPRFPAFQADSLPSEPPGKPFKKKNPKTMAPNPDCTLQSLEEIFENSDARAPAPGSNKT